MYFWGKAWGGVPLDTAAKPLAPAGQQPSPPQPRAVLVPGMLLKRRLARSQLPGFWGAASGNMCRRTSL